MAGIVRKRLRTNDKGEVRAARMADYFDQHGKPHNNAVGRRCTDAIRYFQVAQ